jgi:hypothetical protein
VVLGCLLVPPAAGARASTCRRRWRRDRAPGRRAPGRIEYLNWKVALSELNLDLMSRSPETVSSPMTIVHGGPVADLRNWAEIDSVCRPGFSGYRWQAGRWRTTRRDFPGEGHPAWKGVVEVAIGGAVGGQLAGSGNDHRPKCRSRQPKDAGRGPPRR